MAGYARPMATRARERLLDTAEALFYAEGIRAIGLERILAESGAGRASFYRHFASKDDLVAAVLRRRDEAWRAWFHERVTALGGGPLTVFDALAERFTRADFRGCAFINTMVETADPGSAAHHIADEHKKRVTDYIANLLREHGTADPEGTAARFMLLMDGAIVTALREGSVEPAARAKDLASALV